MSALRGWLGLHLYYQFKINSYTFSKGVTGIRYNVARHFEKADCISLSEFIYNCWKYDFETISPGKNLEEITIVQYLE